MTETVFPGPRRGSVTPPASKSQLHRLLLCAAAADREAVLRCGGISGDIAATIRCLNALGADIRETRPGELAVRPIRVPAREAALPCGESGSTLRFLLPFAGVLGCRAAFLREGRLPARPLAPLTAALAEGGMTFREEGSRLFCEGRLRPGRFVLPGSVSSQFISGLLMALPLLPGDSELTVAGALESAPYVAMTEAVLQAGGVRLERRGQSYGIPGGQRPSFPAPVEAERDWSAAAVFLCMGALSPAGVTVQGLDGASRQGDRAILDLLRSFGALVRGEGNAVAVSRGELRGQRIDASQIPDLVPALSALAALAEGETVIVSAGRLRLKESDRLRGTAAMLAALGADVAETADGLRIRGRSRLRGGTAEVSGDHRLAMAAAVAAAGCEDPVVIPCAECTDKSYPRFWDTLQSLEAAI